MSWLYEKFEVPSEKSGTIVVRRLLGAWEVKVGETHETGPYMTEMWRQQIARIPEERIHRILLLGLGAGGCIDPLRAKFPDAHIIAVEWDPEMVNLFHQLKIVDTEKVELVVGDAREMIKKVSGTFDFILFDLFTGSEPAPMICDPTFLADLESKLRLGGWLLTNIYFRTEYLPIIKTKLSFQWQHQFHLNTVAAFRRFGSGTLGDTLPSGFLPYRAIPAFIQRDFREMARVAVNGVTGTAWKHGPLNFEGYLGDVEPDVPRSGVRRLVLWQPLTRSDRPKGWFRIPVQPNATITGVAEIKQPEAYWEHWSEHARRHRNKFLKDDRFEVIDLPYEQYEQIYTRLPRAMGITGLLTRITARKVERHGTLVEFFGVREKETGTIAGGFATFDIPEAKISVHLASFILPDYRQTSVGVGMVDAWFKRSIAKGIRFNDFDLFRAPGDPTSWHGFSQFKSQFVTHFVKYPKPLARFGK